MATEVRRVAPEPATDEEIVKRVLGGESALFEILMRRYNQRLYRVARSILHNDAQAEDVMQTAYVHAYEHLHQFAGLASFGAWITRIAVNEALARIRMEERYQVPPGEGDMMDSFASPAPDPERSAANTEVARMLESLVEDLPEISRAVFMLRDVEGMSTQETSDALGISQDNVKVRLHRARAQLRQGLETHVSASARSAFLFHAVRCDAVVQGVFARLHIGKEPPQVQ